MAKKQESKLSVSQIQGGQVGETLVGYAVSWLSQ
jgi:hypothetical protein